MRRLVFVDDDPTELENFHKIVGSDYDYAPVHWPDESGKLFSNPVSVPGTPLIPERARTEALVQQF